MNHPVVSALFPVVLLIAIGVLAGRLRWVGTAAVKDLSNLVFMVLAPALLFRTMATAHGGQLEIRPLAIYFAVALSVYFGVLAWLGFTRRSAVLALASMFSNTVMIGVPLVGLAYGERGLFTLFTLISVHALVLLTVATLVLEFAVAREGCAQGGQEPLPQRHLGLTVLLAVRNAVIHPVPLPILAGLLYAQTGWGIPLVIDKPLQLLGQAFGPIALVMVGVTLAANPVGASLREALVISLAKNLLHPVLMAGAGWALGLQGVPLAVMVIAASLPVGANVFLFSQRYQVAQDAVTATVAVSTGLALLTVSAVMLLLGLR
ncbi:MAG: AEC family transporter [Ramlibacter sp.]|nr:AEC family transporter [Ramlibacter sp.]